MKATTSAGIPRAVLAQHLAVLGKTGSGKSSVLRSLVEDLLREGQPVCIVDPKGDWWGLKSSADGKKPGFPVIIFGGAHADLPITEHSGAQVGELVATGNRPCIIDFGGWEVGPRTRFFIEFASALFRHAQGQRWLVIDEVHNFAPQGKVLDPAAGKMLHWANRLASEGRGKGIQLMVASQRPQKVHKDLLTSCETLIAMRVIHPLDRKAVKEWIDGCPDPEKGKEVLDSLASMARGTGWVWSPEIGFGPKQCAFPLFTTYDSFKPATGAAVRLQGWADTDLNDVKSKLATVVKEAEENDPRRLKAEITSLRGQLAKAEKLQPAAAKAERIEVPILTASDREAIEQLSAHLEGNSAVIRQAAADSAEAVNQFAAVLKAGLRERLEGPKAGYKIGNNPTTLSTYRTATHSRPPASARSVNQNRTGAAAISRPQQALLDALAWLESVNIDTPRRGQVALVAKVSSKSSGFEKNVSTLSTLGLIHYPSSGLLALTDEGRDNATLPDRPPTDEEMHRAIEQRLSSPQAALLRILIEHYPDPMSREVLASKANVSPLSSGFEKNVSTLRSLGLIDYPSQGLVAADSVLFLEARR